EGSGIAGARLGGAAARPRRAVVVGVAIAAVAVVLSVVVIVWGGGLAQSATPGPATSPSGTSATPSATAPATEFSAGGLQDPSTGAAPEASVGTPVRMAIARIGVDSTLESLALAADGQLAAPVDWDSAGWYADGVSPGAIGPAIIAGHVDSPTAPAVFWRLAELVPGDEVQVTMSTGAVLVFDVTGSTQSAKAQFPTDEVYSNVPRPELRLITCAGAFDSSIGHYTDNLIVFASLRT
ncbi:class F sortase, partial [Microbacterium sp. P02]|uniref:class F sortase n=1 Tax=Microbacterium sp. P02 TaxID=3366260 RepID=UPI003670B47F